MAPGYRNTQTRRGARAGYPEHDDFEGLPTRQWRMGWVNVAPPPEIEETKKKDIWDEELPHGMPKGSEQLPPHSYALLRAARSGRMHKRPAPAEDEDADADGLLNDKAEKKAAPIAEGFRVKAWKLIPRSEEGPPISHLAKRHKNTVTLPSKALATQLAGPTITKATVRRLDAAGNPYTSTVTVSDGQQVDGEIISTSVIPAPEQAGPVASAGGTPTRRKPQATQKKKSRGRGRGRGRVKMVPASTRSGTQAGPNLGGSSELKSEGLSSNGVKIENEDGKTAQDVEMRDSSVVDDDDGDEGEGEDGDDDEGDESGTPAENEDQEMDDAPALPVPSSAAEAVADGDMQEAASNLAPPASHTLNTDTTQIEGSPLKNVLLRSPEETTPHIPAIAPSTDLGSSYAPDEPNSDLQPAPVDSQPEEARIQEVVEETPLEDVTPTVPQSPVEIIPETVLESTKTALEDTALEDIALEDTAPEGTAPEGTAPEGTALEATALEATAPEATAPEPTALEATALEATAPEATAPEAIVPEATAPEATAPKDTAPEDTFPQATLGDVPTAPTQEPEEPSASSAEQPPSEGIAPANAPVTGNPTSTSDNLETGEAAQAAQVTPEPEAPLSTSAPTEQTIAPEAVPVPMPTEAAPILAPITQAMTEDGTDDGSDILGALGARLDEQAEDDVPQPTSAPAIPAAANPVEPQNQGSDTVAHAQTGED